MTGLNQIVWKFDLYEKIVLKNKFSTRNYGKNAFLKLTQ